MSKLPSSVQKLIEHFGRFPGVGPKSAARMVFYLLNSPTDRTDELVGAIDEMKSSIGFCEICNNLAENDAHCLICSDTERRANQLMVVEDVLDLIAFERTGDYLGKYHVLGGVISPVLGIGPEDINLTGLSKRINLHKGELELIIATNPNLEGEATGMYIKEEHKDKDGITITRIARGVPTGADLDYADRLTLKRALSGRTSL
ncbi:MAG: recombination mediator RecR [Candidatus Dojkabacteria bacterium]